MKDKRLNQPEGLLIDFHFEDIDLFLQMVKAWDLHFQQLEKGQINVGFFSRDQGLDYTWDISTGKIVSFHIITIELQSGSQSQH